MQKESASISGLPNSTLYKFLESILEGLKKGDFDDQLKAYKIAEDKLLDDSGIDLLVHLAGDRLSKEESTKFRLKSPIENDSNWALPIRTSNGIALSFFWEYLNVRDFFLRKHQVTRVVCRIESGDKNTCIEVTFKNRKNSMETVSGFAQLKDVWEEILSRCELFKKGGKNDLQDIDKKLQEFSELSQQKRCDEKR